MLQILATATKGHPISGEFPAAARRRLKSRRLPRPPRV
jgi:hypothetical protein